MDEARPEDGFTGHELVGAVLGAGAEGATDAGRAQELTDVLLAERIERRRVADVGGDARGAMPATDGVEPIGDGGHRFVPRDVLPPPIGRANAGSVETVRIVVEVDHRQTLVAGEALRDRVVPVGGELGQTPVLHTSNEAA